MLINIAQIHVIPAKVFFFNSSLILSLRRLHLIQCQLTFHGVLIISEFTFVYDIMWNVSHANGKQNYR